jgi:ribonuclease J
MLKIIPLGGLGEIGLNMMVFEYDKTMFIVDAGIMFPEDYMLGIDIVIPDIQYIKKNNLKPAGIILTHGHEDHIGALPYVLKELNIPVFATSFTLELVKKKLDERGLLHSALLYEISPDNTLRLGQFEIEFIRVSHSIIDGVGLAIKTPLGTVVHTGDFKINYKALNDMKTDINKFASFGQKGVLALLSDSTNAEKEGHTISSDKVEEKLQEVIRKASGRVIIALFASNINRIQHMINIAKSLGYYVVFNGKSVETSIEIAKRLKYINIQATDEISIDSIGSYPDDKIMIITTGSQGEPMSSLTRMAFGNHKQVKIKDGDTVILSSKFIPGNEKAIAHIINNLYRLGADVIYEKISEIHVSGHAFKEELKLILDITKPKYFIPIHGEYRHLVHHARIAYNMGLSKEQVLLAEDGQTLEFDENGGRYGKKVHTGRVLVDGKGIGDVGRRVLKERRSLSEKGMVIITMAVDQETGIIIFGPEISSSGFIFPEKTNDLLEDAKCVVLEIVEEIKPTTLDRVEKIKTGVRAALRKYFNYAIKRNPVVLPFIIEV